MHLLYDQSNLAIGLPPESIKYGIIEISLVIKQTFDTKVTPHNVRQIKLLKIAARQAVLLTHQSK